MLVIHGSNGRGKSHGARALANWFNRAAINLGPHESRLRDAWFYLWPEVLDGFKSGQWDLVDSMQEHTLLVLDDVGAEHDPSNVGKDKLCQVLSKREKMWTIITTNLKPNEWATKLDNRIASRFIRNSVQVDMTGAADYSTL